ncbi:MAG: type II toxin-antitoxin system VapC family toxin [SAR202 cluster bacterium]|nr:type II toxin-antitoxin system VapC family toxin [SAR202 cluster bacterium]
MGSNEVKSYVLDTNALLWLMRADHSLGRQSVNMADDAMRSDSLFVSAISFWEVAALSMKGRLKMHEPVSDWRRRVLGLSIREIPLSGSIAIGAAQLIDFHADPADRMITATALEHEAVLITAYRTILAWPGNLMRHDARQ